MRGASDRMPYVSDNSRHDLEVLSERVTLHELLAGGHTLVFQCKSCYRMVEQDVGRLVQLHGPETRIGYIRRVTTCETCFPPER